MQRGLFFLLFLFALSAFQNNKPSSSDTSSFTYDYAQPKAHTPLILLEDGDRKVLLAEAYQGRVMTSTAAGMEGTSYGWINHDLISKGEYQPHMNAFGGEERFWLGRKAGNTACISKR